MKGPEIIQMSSGTTIPQIGYGMWHIRDHKEAVEGVHTALEVGYRHFDTAQIYGNEAFLGEALKSGGVPRKDVFVTTKIWNENQYWDDLIESFEESLSKLKTDYVDLLLLHFPVTELRRPAWRQMENLHKSGAARAIGVSNYTIRHLDELLREGTIAPAVNQVELHVYLQQPELVEYCRTHDIVVEAYSPLTHGVGINNPVLREIGKKYGKSAAQVMIRWCLDQETVPLPKSVHPNWIKENFDVFDFQLDAEDELKLEALEQNLRTCWDPTHVA